MWETAKAAGPQAMQERTTSMADAWIWPFVWQALLKMTHTHGRAHTWALHSILVRFCIFLCASVYSRQGDTKVEGVV